MVLVGPVAEEAARCFWSMDSPTGIAVVRGWAVATGFGLAAGSPAASCCSNGDGYTHAAPLAVAASVLTLLKGRQLFETFSKSMCEGNEVLEACSGNFKAQVAVVLLAT